MNEHEPIRGTRLEMTDTTLEKMRHALVLASLSDEQLRCLKHAEEVHVHAGDLVSRQGEMGHFYWIILEGELRISQVTADGNEMAMHVMTAGNSFGEVPLLANIPNGANFRAIGDVHLLRLDEEGFWGLMTTCPEVRKAILGDMAMRYQKMQGILVHQEKMASLGTLGSGAECMS